jgi:hypothetical protein
MVATVLPAMDPDLLRALKRVAGKVLADLGELPLGKEPSDRDLVALYGRIVDVLVSPGLDAHLGLWVMAFELLWPKRTIDLARLSEAALSQLRPDATYEEVRVAFKAARAAVSAFELAGGSARVGRRCEPRGEAEAFLRTIGGYSFPEIAAFTDPQEGGAGRVRQRVDTVVKAKAVPVVALYSAHVQERKSAELTPSIALGGRATSKTFMEVTSNGRTQRNKRRQRLPPTRRGGPDNPSTGK